jgi:prolipoprotein diacylglyceryltransferase
MVSDKQTIELETAKKFEPLEIMGIFWLVFGIVVLVSTFFVEATPQVPLVRGVVTNMIAGLLLVGAGIFSIVKAKVNKRKTGT